MLEAKLEDLSAEERAELKERIEDPLRELVSRLEKVASLDEYRLLDECHRSLPLMRAALAEGRYEEVITEYRRLRTEVRARGGTVLGLGIVLEDMAALAVEAEARRKAEQEK